MHEIEKFSMLDTSNECYLIKDSDNIEMNNRLCRFLLCWWFATTVCLMTGKTNLIELPNCLVEKIRTVCPDQNENCTRHESK